MSISNDEAMCELISMRPAAQSIKDFCREHHIGEAKFYYWNRKLKNQQASFAAKDNSGFIPLKVKGSIEEGRPLARITFNSGSSITVYNPVVFSLLRDLL
ncbi:MAG: IS66 family insertion sequence element accessory protein TnpA [Candidatus Saccharimonadales bacterium]